MDRNSIQWPQYTRNYSFHSCGTEGCAYSSTTRPARSGNALELKRTATRHPTFDGGYELTLLPRVIHVRRKCKPAHRMYQFFKNTVVDFKKLYSNPKNIA
ncbi:hypothetical protein A0H81_13906 [Grifola frondosa]|uniref:Uncharacterized protein n=1 Tax=Grifola frondosa TaxID=5627 RepID=A0A1C7LPH7_GRIFR|nr:hypothetical protein A0H81_13906 [Grifola frondosa]